MLLFGCFAWVFWFFCVGIVCVCVSFVCVVFLCFCFVIRFVSFVESFVSFVWICLFDCFVVVVVFWGFFWGCVFCF